MAKKNKKTASKSFTEILDIIQDIVPESNIVDNDETLDITAWVGTGSYILNGQMTGSIFKGIPEGRTVMWAGDPGVGKTFLTLNSAREAQRKYNSIVVWLDSEGDMNKTTMKRFGIDTARAIIVPVQTIRQSARVIINLLQNLSGDNPFEYFLVLDSQSNLTSNKELEDLLEGNDKRDMTKQQEMKAMFRSMLTLLRIKRVPLVLTTHVYDKIGAYVPTKEISGGTGGKYGASITNMLSKKKLKDKDDNSTETNDEKQQTGVIITSTQVKARYTKAGISVNVHVSFIGGMNPYVGLEKYLDWETMGVAPGKMVEEYEEYTTKTGSIKRRKTGNFIFEPEVVDDIEKAKNWAIRSLNTHIPRKEFFKYAKHIFTKENLLLIDEKVKAQFEFLDYAENAWDFEDELDQMIDIATGELQVSDEEMDALENNN
jgi:RecA/RadA recombinase